MNESFRYFLNEYTFCRHLWPEHVDHEWFATKLTMKTKYIHRLEGRVRKVRLQDVFDGDNVVMFEMLKDLQLSQCAFGICQHLKGIGDLLYCHLLAWKNTAGQT